MIQYPRFIFCLIFLTLFTSSSIVAQKAVGNRPFLKLLLRDTSNILEIQMGLSDEKSKITIDDIPFQKDAEVKKYVKNKEGLFGFVEGTGRVYQFNELGSEIQIQRIDSTLFFGYNFGSYEFSYNDTLYSFGGYGFWHYNGHLRYFIKEKAEWEPFPLSEEIPSANNNGAANKIWVDKINGDLFLLNAVGHSDSLYRLDLKTKQWETLGKNLLQETITYLYSTPWGLLCFYGSFKDPTYSLLNFELNQIQTLSKEQSSRLSAYAHSDGNVYIKDSTIYFTKKFDEGDLNSIQLSILDFTPTGKNIYQELSAIDRSRTVLEYMNQKWRMTAVVLISFVSGMFLVFVYNKIKRQRIKKQRQNGFEDIFDEKEKDLLNMIWNNSKIKKPTTIENINQTLGLIDKNSDLQKKHRSDTISAINNKYHIATGQSTNLVLSKRSEFDKRSFEYYIEMSSHNDIRKLFN